MLRRRPLVWIDDQRSHICPQAPGLGARHLPYPPVPVIFRVWRDTGDVIALFPTQIHDGKLITAYMHIGQHSGADYASVLEHTRPATAREYAPLLRELQGKPYEYDLIVRRRRVR